MMIKRDDVVGNIGEDSHIGEDSLCNVGDSRVLNLAILTNIQWQLAASDV